MVGFMCQTMNGFDGSLFNGLTANTVFKTTFNGSSSGSWAAIVSAMYQIGGVVALPAVGPCIDTWGRRAGMFIGSIFIILGTIVSGLSNVNGANLGMFMGGRFLLGFGVSIASAAGPIYVVEMAHPTFRGIATGQSSLRSFVDTSNFSVQHMRTPSGFWVAFSLLVPSGALSVCLVKCLGKCLYGFRLFSPARFAFSRSRSQSPQGGFMCTGRRNKHGRYLLNGMAVAAQRTPGSNFSLQSTTNTSTRKEQTSGGGTTAPSSRQDHHGIVWPAIACKFSGAPS